MMRKVLNATLENYVSRTRGYLDKLNVRLTKWFFVKFITSSRCLNKTVAVPPPMSEVIMTYLIHASYFKGPNGAKASC